MKLVFIYVRISVRANASPTSQIRPISTRNQTGRRTLAADPGRYNQRQNEPWVRPAFRAFLDPDPVEFVAVVGFRSGIFVRNILGEKRHV